MKTTKLETLRKLGVNVNMMTRHTYLESARTHAASMRGVNLVIMGDDGRYWVIKAKEAARLRKAGFETI